MSDNINIDFSQLDTLAADLGKAPDGIGKNLTKTMQVAAGNVKKGWRERLKPSFALPGAAASVSYDIKTAAGLSSEITAEIGPTLTGQGPLAGLVETGAPARGLSPHGYGLAALQEELPDFERGIDAAIDDSLKAAGL